MASSSEAWNEVWIRLCDKNKILVEERKGPFVSSKYISPSQLGEIFAAVMNEDITMQTPILPKNCIAYTAGTTRETYVIEKEAHRQDVTYAGTVFKDVGFPKLLFGIQLCQYNDRFVVEETALAAVKNDYLVRKDTPVYRYPFSNVYHTCRCCWGHVRKPEIKDPVQLSSLLDFFLSQEDNGDLYSSCNNSGLEYRPFLEQLQGRDFPLEWLMPVRHGYTAEDFINDINK